MMVRNWFKTAKQHFFLPVALSILSLALLGGLGVFAYLGSFSRYGADDYCFSRTLFQSGNIIQATITWYLNTSNRFTTMLLVGISEWFGPKAIGYLPGMAILLWVIGLTWTLGLIAKKLKLPYPRLTGFGLAVMIAFFTILEAPNRYQSLYWRSAMVTYFAPLLAFSFLIGWLVKEIWRETPRRLAGQIVAAALMGLGFFLAGGLSETTLAIQGGALGLAVLAAWLLLRGRTRSMALALLITSLVASSAALVIMLFAPANALRVEHFGPPASLISIISRSLTFAWDFIRNSLLALPTPHLVSLAMGLFLGYGLYSSQSHLTQKRVLLASLVVVPLVCYLLCIFAVAPSVYGQNSYPGERSLITPQAVLVTTVVFFGLLVGLGLRTWIGEHVLVGRKLAPLLVLTSVLLLTLSAYYPYYSSKQTFESARWYARRAQQWDLRDAEIRQAVASGETDVVVQQLDTIGGVQEYKANNWVNRCAAEYYGLNSLTAP